MIKHGKCCSFYSMLLLVIMDLVMAAVAFAPDILAGFKGNGFVTQPAMLALTMFYIISFIPLIKSDQIYEPLIVNKAQKCILTSSGIKCAVFLIIPFLFGIKTATTANLFIEFDKTALMQQHGIGDVFLLLLSCFSKISLFFALCLLFLVPSKKYLGILLLILSLTDILLTINRGGRSKIITWVLFAFVTLWYFYCSQKKLRKKIFCIAIVLGALMLIPFLFISYYRFSDKFLIELYHYLVAGPYFFNLDYQILYTEEAFPGLNGLLTLAPIRRVILPIIGIPAPDLLSEATFNDEIRNYYWQLGGASNEEFKTILGTFIMDFSKFYYVVYLIPCFFIMFIPTKNTLSRCLLVVVYSYILIFSFIGYPFVTIYGNLELLIFLYYFFMLNKNRDQFCPIQ